MGRKDGNKKCTAGETVNDENSGNSSRMQVGLQDGEANASLQLSEATSLTKVLEEIRDFCKDTKQQLTEIISEITSVNQKLAEAETRIGRVEDRVQNVEQLMSKMIKVINQQENKLLDQEGRSRRENIRLYNVPEGSEGTSMVTFVEKLLRDTLEILPNTDLGIERAHRALAPKPSGDGGGKPRSIIIKFHRYRIKEEILHKAWAKKKVLLNERPIYFDQDYPPPILQKRKEYSEAKRILKQKQIRFQTPFPAKLRVFYDDGMRLYQSAGEATADMKDRGLPVNVITPRESLSEQLSRTVWEMVRGPRQQVAEEEREKNIRERLQAFRRGPLSPPEEL